MLKKFACAVALVLVGSVALADTIRGYITAASKGEITIVTGKGEDKKTQTIDVGAKCQVFTVKGKSKDKDDSTIDKLADAIAASTGKVKGVGASIEVKGKGKDKKVTEITYRTFGKKKPTKDD